MTEMTTTRRPRYSLVIPTRDRPAHLSNALESAVLQSFKDFEVIVCDNHTSAPCKDIVEAFADPRIRYVTPDRQISMHDNWEHAVSLATGDFVLVLIDKTMLRLSTLTALEKATASHPAEIYSWTSDAFYLTNEAEHNAASGYLVPVRDAGDPFYVDCASELERRLAFNERIGAEGPAYTYGKICFGAYSRELIARIKQRFGRLFIPIAPDYTSMTMALMTADRLVDLNQSLLISSMTTISNGRLFAERSAHARRFLEQSGFTEKSFETLPIPGVFCALHNLVAYDYRPAWQPDPNTGITAGKLDYERLWLRVEKDLMDVQEWASETEKSEITDRFWQFTDQISWSGRRRIFELLKSEVEAETSAREASLDARQQQLDTREQQLSSLRTRLNPSQIATQARNALSRRMPSGSMLKTWLFSSPSQPQPQPPETAQQDGKIAPNVPYPTFETTLDALRFAETDQYTYPFPCDAAVKSN